MVLYCMYSTVYIAVYSLYIEYVLYNTSAAAELLIIIHCVMIVVLVQYVQYTTFFCCVYREYVYYYCTRTVLLWGMHMAPIIIHAVRSIESLRGSLNSLLKHDMIRITV